MTDFIKIRIRIKSEDMLTNSLSLMLMCIPLLTSETESANGKEKFEIAKTSFLSALHEMNSAIIAEIKEA